MPPRYAYWTILIDNTPTAFRSRDQAELLPTLNQLRRKSSNVVMKWFARGRLWDTPEQAQWAGTNLNASTEKRGKEWRPGGQHKDPRARFDRKKDAPKKDHRQQRGDRPSGVAQIPGPAREKPADAVQDVRSASRTSFRPADGGKSFTPAHGKKFFRPADGKKSFQPADGRKSFRPAEGRKSFRPADGKKFFQPADGRKSFRPADGKKSFRPADDRKSFRPADDRKHERPWKHDRTWRPGHANPVPDAAAQGRRPGHANAVPDAGKGGRAQRDRPAGRRPPWAGKNPASDGAKGRADETRARYPTRDNPAPGRPPRARDAPAPGAGNVHPPDAHVAPRQPIGEERQIDPKAEAADRGDPRTEDN